MRSSFVNGSFVANSNASVVAKINGVDAATYVADWIYQASFNQDADAAYNSMFFKSAFLAGGVGNGYFSSNGRARYTSHVLLSDVGYQANRNITDTYILDPTPLSLSQMEQVSR